jgi:hypothetical protein
MCFEIAVDVCVDETDVGVAAAVVVVVDDAAAVGLFVVIAF